MANNVTPSPFLGAVRAAFVNADRTLTLAALQLFQDWDARLTKGLNLIGQFTGNIAPTATVGARPEPIGTTLTHITATGQLASLTNVAADVDTDHIADGAGSPLAGGKAATAAFVASTTGKPMVYHLITGWGPGTVPYAQVSGGPAAPGPGSAGPIAHQWIASYDPGTGVYSLSQPAFADISGQITGAQLPASGLSVTIVTAQLTGPGAQGSMTFTGGILTAQTPAT